MLPLPPPPNPAAPSRRPREEPSSIEGESRGPRVEERALRAADERERERGRWEVSRGMAGGGEGAGELGRGIHYISIWICPSFLRERETSTPPWTNALCRNRECLRIFLVSLVPARGWKGTIRESETYRHGSESFRGESRTREGCFIDISVYSKDRNFWQLMIRIKLIIFCNREFFSQNSHRENRGKSARSEFLMMKRETIKGYNKFPAAENEGSNVTWRARRIKSMLSRKCEPYSISNAWKNVDCLMRRKSVYISISLMLAKAKQMSCLWGWYWLIYGCNVNNFPTLR